MANRGSATQVVDLKRRKAIPRLNGLRVHLILGGVSFNMELRREVEPFAYAQGQGRYEEARMFLQFKFWTSRPDPSFSKGHEPWILEAPASPPSLFA